MLFVVSDVEKASWRRQVGIGKTNASESLLKCRYWIRWHQNWGETGVPWEEPGGCPLIGQAVSGM